MIYLKKQIYNYQLGIIQHFNHTIWFNGRSSDELSIIIILSELDFSKIYFDNNTGKCIKEPLNL